MVTIEDINFTCKSNPKGLDSSELPPFAELMLRCPRAVVEEVALLNSNNIFQWNFSLPRSLASSMLYTAAAGRVLPYHPVRDQVTQVQDLMQLNNIAHIFAC